MQYPQTYFIYINLIYMYKLNMFVTTAFLLYIYI